MTWFETLRTGLEAVRSHRLRSGLTVLGILIGIAAVMLTVGIGQGAQAQVSSEITALGTNLLSIDPGSSSSTTGIRGGLGTAGTLTLSDAQALSSKVACPDIRAVAATDSSSEPLTAGTSTWTSTVVGSTPSWLVVHGRSMTEGRFLDHRDVEDHTAVAVLGSTTASELFSREDPVGQTVNVNGVPMTVVGVLDTVGSSGSSGSTTATSDPDDQVVVPITTAAERLFDTADRNSADEILVQATSASTLSAAYQEADTELLALHHVTDSTDADFTIDSEASEIQASTSVDRTLTLFLGGVAGISLLVGGIGVMNIMLVSVTERVREIGLRKALGGTPRVILRQFLLEASVLGVAGGALGIVLGVIGALSLPGVIGYPISLSLPVAALALVVAVTIGLIAGVYPAMRAARLAPIDALRSE